MCTCTRGPIEWWVIYYPRLFYRVCTACLHKRLDQADEDPTLEPDEVLRYSVT